MLCTSGSTAESMENIPSINAGTKYHVIPFANVQLVVSDVSFALD